LIEACGLKARLTATRETLAAVATMSAVARLRFRVPLSLKKVCLAALKM
jgi:hypothetical protein